MKKILIFLALILICSASGCTGKPEPTERPAVTENTAPTVQSEATQAPAGSAVPTEIPTDASDGTTEPTDPFDRSATEEWVRDGIWCMIADDGVTLQIYTFSDKDAGNGTNYGYCTLYHISGDAIVKDSAPDNPSAINYRFDEDGNISTVGEGGLQMTFYLSDNGMMMNQTGTGFTNTYHRMTEVPESYDALAQLLSSVM